METTTSYNPEVDIAVDMINAALIVATIKAGE